MRLEGQEARRQEAGKLMSGRRVAQEADKKSVKGNK